MSPAHALRGFFSFVTLNTSKDFSFFFFWLRWVFVAARRLSLVAVSGVAEVPGLLTAVASLVVEHGL